MRVAVNTASRYGNQAFSLALGIFLPPYLLHHLGPEMLGLQVLAMQALQFCLMIGTAYSRGYTRFAAVHHARGDYAAMNQTLGRGVTLTLLIAGVGGLITLVLVALADRALGLDGEVLRVGRWVILIVGLGYVFDQVTELWGAMLFMAQKFYIQALAQLVAKAMAAVGVVLLFEYGKPSMIGWVLLTVGSTVLVKCLMVVPAGWQGVPEAKLRPVAPRGAEFWEMTRFSAASLVAGLGFLLYYGSSAIIITNLPELGAGKIMHYSLGQRWDTYIRDGVLALASAVTPVFTSLFARGAMVELRGAFLRTSRHSLLLGMLPCVLMLVDADRFIGLWVGREYVVDSALILRISMVNVLISIPAIVGFEALLGVGRIGKVAWMTVFGGGANIVLSILLVKAGLGLAGIAIATLLTWGVVTCLYIMGLVGGALQISAREFGRESLLRPILAGLPLAAAAVAIRSVWPPPTWPALLIEWTLCGLVYLGLVYGVGLNPLERAYLARVSREKLADLGLANGGAAGKPMDGTKQAQGTTPSAGKND